MNLPRPHRAFGWVDAVNFVASAIVIAVFVVTFIVQAFQIPSESMENTLLIGDYLLVDKLHFGGDGFWSAVMPYRKVQRGDIVVFHYPVQPRVHFVKRVVAVPGDRLRLIDKKVYVNGKLVEEPYVRYSRPHDNFRDDFPRLDMGVVSGLTGSWWIQLQKLVEDNQLIVPEKSYFVMGDNRDDSLDSRYWGFVPQENIVGRPLVIYWSMKNADADPAPITASDKLYRFLYAMGHIVQSTRWDRTLRLVR